MKEKEIKTIENYLESSIPLDTNIVPQITQIGEVIYIGDGICKVKGLPNARIDDMIKIKAKGEDVYASILGLNQDLVESVVLGDYTKISKGDTVKSSKRRVTIPVGDAVFGRVLNPLGKPLDGKGELLSHKSVPIEIPAPPVNEREQITEQIRTGVLVVDSIIPVGKGQRELVIGDRKTGKTTLMTNMIKNQKGKGVYCVYVSIGGKKAKVKGIIETLESSGAFEYSVVILATADDPPSLNYIAPYSGCAIAEYLMRNGKDAIVIYDDLSKQAKAYRQMSLLLKRSPGRDAYPGDIFFLHSRLLERSARIGKDFGGGSSTAFPIAETQSGDVSEYITTNLMSITDGHIYLDANLLHAGIVPAVDSGFSVSRIGGSIQTKLLRKLSEVAASQLQRYNEVKSYENINTEITEETEREIKRGKRLLEIVNQPSSINLALEEEVLYLYVVTQGKIDDMELADVKKLKKELLRLIQYDKNVELKERLKRTDLSVDDISDFMDAIFTADFLQSLVSIGMKDDVDTLIKKELNRSSLATAPELSTKAGLTGDLSKKTDNSIALEGSELQPKDPTPTNDVPPIDGTATTPPLNETVTESSPESTITPPTEALINPAPTVEIPPDANKVIEPVPEVSPGALIDQSNAIDAEEEVKLTDEPSEPDLESSSLISTQPGSMAQEDQVIDPLDDTKDTPEETSQLASKPNKPSEVLGDMSKVYPEVNMKKPPIDEKDLGEVINNIEEDEPPIKVIDV